MLKLCRNLPRVGVGFLGLALVSMFSMPARAESLRRGGTTSSTVSTLAGVPAGANPADVTPGDPPSVQEFSVAGSGSVNYVGPDSDCIAAGLTCNTGQTCQCMEVTGNVTDGLGPLYHGTASLLLSIVNTVTYPNGNSAGNPSGQVCFFASGILSVSPAVGSTITFITSGPLCNGPQSGSTVYSGGFLIGSSTGGFSNAVGAGTLSYGANFFTDTGVFDLKGAGTGLN